MASDYVIMLDDYLEVYSSYWPISGRADDKETLRKQKQHDGNPSLLSRDEYEMSLEENKSLINAQTGIVDKGGIYKRTAK